MEILTKHSTANNSLLKVIFTSLFIGLPFLGFYLGMQYQSLITETSEFPATLVNRPIPTPHLSNQPYPTLSNNQNEMAGWKIYQNNNPKYKYTFKYPSEWNITKTPNQDNKTTTIKTSLGGWLTVTLDLKGLGLECEKTVSEKQIKVDGQNATKTITEGLSDNDICTKIGTKSIWVTINSNGIRHLISVSSPTENYQETEKLFDQILSTFKFLE